MMWARCITSLMHNEVICVGKETTKLRVAYDTSARTESNPASLTDCHDAGPPQCLLSAWLRFSVHQVAITGEIEKQFSADCFSWPKIHVAWGGLLSSQTDTQHPSVRACFQELLLASPPKSLVIKWNYSSSPYLHCHSQRICMWMTLWAVMTLIIQSSRCRILNMTSSSKSGHWKLTWKLTWN